jgi:hypothetical protein
MDFSMRLWLLPLFVLPGLWLAVRLYLRGPLGRSETHRLVPAVLYALGWLGIGLLALSPLWRWPSETWHPPLVALVVDESESYAALGARDSARRVMRDARAHYEALGFKVVETGFDPAKRNGPAVVADFSNLQAVFVWTDGRFDAGATPWPAPLFPVRVHLASGEVQGERAEVHLTAIGADGAQPAPWLTVEGRMAGSGAPGSVTPQAEVVIQDGKKILWKTTWNLSEGGSDRSAPSRSLVSGDRVSARFTLPRELAQGDPSRWKVRVLPARAAANVRVENDTVPVTVRGNRSPTRIVLRPLVSLEERGLLDALRNNGDGESAEGDEKSDDGESNAARAVEASALSAMELSQRMVVWVRADSKALTQATQATVKAKASIVVYERTRSGENFGPDARLGWRADGGAYLPAGALRLADLGATDAAAMSLRQPDASIEALAWAEENGRRGVLFWRNRRDARFGFALPPLWRATFSAGASSLESARATADVSAQWARGASDWARALGSRSTVGSARGNDVNKSSTSSVSPNKSGSETQAPELSRLGSDVEALARLALSGNGNTINSYSNDIDSELWPVLPGGQTRAASTRIIALAPPFLTALLVAALFSIVWWMRKRLRLD